MFSTPETSVHVLDKNREISPGFVWKVSFEPGWKSDYVMDGDGNFDGDCVHSKIDGTLEVLERKPQSE